MVPSISTDTQMWTPSLTYSKVPPLKEKGRSRQVPPCISLQGDRAGAP
jgi:hypothetical protein